MSDQGKIFQQGNREVPPEKQPLSPVSVVVEFSNGMSLSMYRCRDDSVEFMILTSNGSILAFKNESKESVSMGFGFLVSR